MRPPIFYGWCIVAAGFTIEGLIGALLFHAYGAYVVLLREEFGWISRSRRHYRRISSPKGPEMRMTSLTGQAPRRIIRTNRSPARPA